ncbi:hypothetical protein [Pseudoalteromonas sp. Of7M-16]|jgi:hypothetical protein|uniref:hypothetical protein n=1 Tax=Pseudoalteromonas sp. Of7M-16 TaxID=2917756 RepID=UPI001EF4EF2F|nr:hypothetical protein [Pseudoalteromonas sp. Of7M-16]MCG7550939.1 hypothetical protein [Pseudoalteromonas sp. Of7M-16]
MAIFQAIQTQNFHEKLQKYALGKVPECRIKDAVIGHGWLKNNLPDKSQVPTVPFTSVPNQFKTLGVVMDFVNGKQVFKIETSDFAENESHEYNIVVIRDNDNEAAYVLIGQTAWVSKERPLIVDATFELQVVVLG